VSLFGNILHTKDLWYQFYKLAAKNILLNYLCCKTTVKEEKRFYPHGKQKPDCDGE
jgi:hypothetical protein